MAHFKRLSLLLVAEGKLAESDNRIEEAARSYLDAIRLGSKTSRGGMIINRLSGVACESLGLSSLAKLTPRLNADQQRRLLAELLTLDRNSPDWTSVVEAERSVIRQQSRGFNPLIRLVTWWNTRKVTDQARLKHDRSAASIRLLALELALRCYQSSHASGPAKLDQLVPEYLPFVPSDPFTSHQFIYRPNGTNWLLYSVGPDRRDDGGTPASGGMPTKGDLFYDSR